MLAQQNPNERVEPASLTKLMTAYLAGSTVNMTVDGQPDYQSVRRIAEGVAAILKDADDSKCPLYLTLDLDIAKSLGGILKDELKVDRDIIAVDGIEVGDLDYIDIGECLGITEVIPVTVKSLMFPTAHSG